MRLRRKPRPPLSEVTLQASFDAPPQVSPSRLLGEFVIGRLITFGIDCREPVDHGDWVTIECRIERRRFQLLIGEHADEASVWRLAIRSRLGLFRRWRESRERAEHLHLARALHKALSAEARISRVEWRGAEDWASLPGDSWWDKEPPQAA